MRRRDLAMLSEHHVRDAYHQAYERCRTEGDAPPSAIQELVTVWKLLWSWRRRRRSTLP